MKIYFKSVVIIVFYCIVLVMVDNYVDVCDNDFFIIGKYVFFVVILVDCMKIYFFIVDEMKLVVL